MKTAVFIIIGFLVCSCHGNKLKIPSHPAIPDLANSIRLENDTTTVALSDYFTHPEKINKIISPEELQVIVSEDLQSIRLIPSAGIHPIENIGFCYEGYTYDIPVFKDRVQSTTDLGEVPVLFTDVLNGDTVYLRGQNTITDLFVYIRNYKLNAKSFIFSGDRLGIVLPKEISELKSSELRVWAANKAGVSNHLLIPVEEGKVITDIRLQELLKEHKASFYIRLDSVHKKSIHELLAAIESDETIETKNIHVNSFCRQNMAMIYGDFILLRQQDGVYAYLRSYFEKDVVVVFNKSKESITLKFDLPRTSRLPDFKSLFGGRFSYDNSKLILDVPPDGVEVIYN